jgi:non-lysosomal glucosylceramidase
MIFTGMVSQGLELIESARRRYDGERRNAWGEAECGYFYARPMASWAALLALSGFRYNAAEKNVTAEPRIQPARFSSFWSAATAWGTFSRTIDERDTSFSLSVIHGELACRSVTLAGGTQGRTASSASLGPQRLEHKLRRQGDHWVFLFAQEVLLSKGDRLSLLL